MFPHLGPEHVLRIRSEACSPSRFEHESSTYYCKLQMQIASTAASRTAKQATEADMLLNVLKLGSRNLYKPTFLKPVRRTMGAAADPPQAFSKQISKMNEN